MEKYIKCGKGLLGEANNLGVLQYTGKINWKEIEETFKKLDAQQREQQKLKSQRFKDNIKALNQRAKELGKEIPNHLLAVVYMEQPQGSWFFEKYKEWFE